MNPLAVITAFALAVSSAAADFTRVDVPLGPRGTDLTLQLFVFDSRRTSLTIIDQGGLSGQTYRNLDQAMRAHFCVAGCNGGPSSRNGQPSGLVIASGKSSGAANLTDPLAQGVVFLDGRTLRMERAKPHFQRSRAKAPDQLLQTGPFLVENGKAASALAADRYGRRTFILTDGQHRWAIGYCPPTTLAQLARTLADPKTFKDFNVASALALGDGSAAGLWVKQAQHPFYLQELDPVRNFIGLVRR